MNINNITIYIPTIGRINNQITLNNLPGELQYRTVLLVDKSEYDDHLFEYSSICNVQSVEKRGIHNVRQYAVNNCKTPYMFLLDDDMVFFRRDFASIKLSPCSDQDILEMFNILVEWMEFPHLRYMLVGLSARQGNHLVEDDFVDITRQMNFHGIRLDLFKGMGFRFDRSEVMEDFNLLLDMFTRGIPNRVMYQFCWNQKGSGSKGGCSTYRTDKLQKKCAEDLKNRYPDFVRLVEKKSKSAWKGMETRTDVNVQWKKAFRSYYIGI